MLQKRVSFILQSPFQRHFLSSLQAPQQPLNPQIDSDQLSTVYNIITSSSSSAQMLHSLSPHLPFTDPDLLDSLLKRARFSHSNPLRLLHFFHLVLDTNSKRTHFSPSPFSFDTMLYILGRSRHFHHSWSLLLRIKREYPSSITPKTLQIVLARVAKVCSVRQTVESFKKFKKLVHPFSTSCFNALLRTLCQEKSMSDARNVYHSLKHEFRPDLQTFNILLSGWKGVEDAESFLYEMKELGVDPDLCTYNILIDVYCKNRDVAKAYKLFDEMREKEIYPDVISYTSLIGGLGLIGQPDKAKEVLKEMKESGCYPDVAAYNAVIRNFCIAKRIGNAFTVLEEMEKEGLKPNPVSYNLFFRVFYWGNDLESAWRLYRKMKCEPNVQSCMFLVRLCRRQEKVEMGMELWKDMVEKGFGSYRLVSDVLFELLCDWGKLEEAERCFLEMVEKGHRPSNVSFRRIRVLMELAGKDGEVREVEEMMERFGNYVEVEEERRREQRRLDVSNF